MGKVIRVIVEPQTQQVLQYVVKGGNFIKRMFNKELIISRQQVISITKEKMVVADTMSKIKVESSLGFVATPSSE